MKTQKKIASFLVVLMLLGTSGVFLNSCKKYEENDSMSLLSPKKRIVGTWMFEETVLNGTSVNINYLISLIGGLPAMENNGLDIDLTQLVVNSIKVKLNKDETGEFIVSASYMSLPVSHTEKITWSFEDKKDFVKITLKDKDEKFKIIKLTKKDLWLEKEQDGSVVVAKCTKE